MMFLSINWAAEIVRAFVVAQKTWQIWMKIEKNINIARLPKWVEPLTLEFGVSQIAKIDLLTLSKV